MATMAVFLIPGFAMLCRYFRIDAASRRDRCPLPVLLALLLGLALSIGPAQAEPQHEIGLL